MTSIVLRPDQVNRKGHVHANEDKVYLVLEGQGHLSRRQSGTRPGALVRGHWRQPVKNTPFTNHSGAKTAGARFYGSQSFLSREFASITRWRSTPPPGKMRLIGAGDRGSMIPDDRLPGRVNAFRNTSRCLFPSPIKSRRRLWPPGKILWSTSRVIAGHVHVHFNDHRSCRRAPASFARYD